MDGAHIKNLAEYFLKKINENITHVIRNGDPEETFLGLFDLN